MRDYRIFWGGRFVALFLVAAFAGFLTNEASAKYASIVIEPDTGRIIHSVNADTRNYPASLTKMMTLYLTFEALDSGKVKLGTPLTVSARAARQPASRLGLRAKRTITVHQAILALVTKSANDVAVVVAEALGGTERNFAKEMTATARRLGMKRTTFRNASGLYNRGQLTTARDMATLAYALMTDFSHYYHFFSTNSFTYQGRVHKNHNKLLESYEGTDGIKTGYIRASGFNLVASVRRDGRRLIGVVMGGKSSSSRNRHMVSLLDKGFATLSKEEGPSVGMQTAALTGTRPSEEAEGDADDGEDAIARGGDWGVQVGAFLAYDPAYAIAVKAVSRVPRNLEVGTIKVEPLKTRKRTLYRARVLGIEKTDAYQACRALKKRRMDCMVLRVKKGV